MARPFCKRRLHKHVTFQADRRRPLPLPTSYPLLTPSLSTLPFWPVCGVASKVKGKNKCKLKTSINQTATAHLQSEVVFIQEETRAIGDIVAQGWQSIKHSSSSMKPEASWDWSPCHSLSNVRCRGLSCPQRFRLHWLSCVIYLCHMMNTLTTSLGLFHKTRRKNRSCLHLQTANSKQSNTSSLQGQTSCICPCVVARPQKPSDRWDNDAQDHERSITKSNV